MDFPPCIWCTHIMSNLFTTTCQMFQKFLKELNVNCDLLPKAEESRHRWKPSFFRNCHHIFVLDLYSTACFLFTRVFFPVPGTWVRVRTQTLTSTENFFPKVNKKGCISISGSFWKQLGLAWCLECRRVHHLADAPCFSEEQSVKSTMLSEIDSLQFPSFTQCWTHAFTGKPSNLRSFSGVGYLQSNGTSQTYAASGSTWSSWILKDVLSHAATMKLGPRRGKRHWEGRKTGIEARTMPHLSFALKYQDLFLRQCSKVTTGKEL